MTKISKGKRRQLMRLCDRIRANTMAIVDRDVALALAAFINSMAATVPQWWTS